MFIKSEHEWFLIAGCRGETLVYFDFTISRFPLCGDGTLVARRGLNTCPVSQDTSCAAPGYWAHVTSCHQCEYYRRHQSEDTADTANQAAARGQESFGYLISPPAWWIRVNSYHDQSPARNADLAFSSLGCDWKLWLIEWSPVVWGLGPYGPSCW